MNKLEIPEGYRLLDPTEIIKEGDLVEYGDIGVPLKWRLKSYRVGEIAGVNYRYIRNIDKNMEIIKVNREQYKQLFELACGPWRKVMLSEYNMSVVDEIDVPLKLINQAIYEADDIKKNKIKEILKMHPKEGTLLLVKSHDQYYLRFADGKGGYYINLTKSVTITLEDIIKNGNIFVCVFDPNNLPDDLKWDKSKNQISSI